MEGWATEKRLKQSLPERSGGWETSGGNNEVGRRCWSRWKVPCSRFDTIVEICSNLADIYSSLTQKCLIICGLSWSTSLLSFYNPKIKADGINPLQVVSHPVGPAALRQWALWPFFLFLRVPLTCSRSSLLQNTASAPVVIPSLKCVSVQSECF